MNSLSHSCIGRHATEVERVYQLFGFGDDSPARRFGRNVRRCLPQRNALSCLAISGYRCLAACCLTVCGALCTAQVSLNLMHVCDYGTLEFRRFESSFDDSRLVSWAHFCVCFVECFSANGEQLAADFLASPIEAFLRELQNAQERAMAAELLDLMSDYCHPGLAEFLQTHHSGSAAPSPPAEETPHSILAPSSTPPPSVPPSPPGSDASSSSTASRSGSPIPLHHAPLLLLRRTHDQRTRWLFSTEDSAADLPATASAQPPPYTTKQDILEPDAIASPPHTAAEPWRVTSIPEKGHGVVATRHIRRSERILAEPPILTCPATARGLTDFTLGYHTLRSNPQ